MSSRPRLAQLATEALAREHVPPPRPSSKDEERAVARIREAIVQARARKRRRVAFFASGGFAAAAAVALVVFVRDGKQPAAVSVSVTGQVVVTRAGRELPAGQASSMEERDRVSTPPGGHASLKLSTGTTLDVEGGGDLTLERRDRTQAFALGAGAVRLAVAKLTAGERFLVRTRDAEVEVRGTAFRVAVVPSDPGCGGGTTTRVTVDEGVVVVRAGGTEERVAAGEQWPRGCDAPPPAPSVTASVAPTAVPPAPRATAPRAPAPSATASAPRPASSLAEQNELFARAEAAKRQGNARAALEAFDQFLARYPSSALGETAFVERMRVLATLDRARAAEAARRYLAAYPRGFARDEAAALAGTRP